VNSGVAGLIAVPVDSLPRLARYYGLPVSLPVVGDLLDFGEGFSREAWGPSILFELQCQHRKYL
jgi:hypothetical protein